MKLKAQKRKKWKRTNFHIFTFFEGLILLRRFDSWQRDAYEVEDIA